jgi:hypothetical protein
MTMPNTLRPMTEVERLRLREMLLTMPEYAGWQPIGMEDVAPPDNLAFVDKDGQHLPPASYSRFWIAESIEVTE